MHRRPSALTIAIFVILVGFLNPFRSGPAVVAAGSDYDALVALYKDIRADAIPTRLTPAADLSATAIQARAGKIPEFRQRLAAIDPGKWPVDQHVDYLLVRAALDNLDFEHRVLHPWSSDPGFYVDMIQPVTYPDLPVQ